MRADPRPSNHGGHTPLRPGVGVGGSEVLDSRFDWYQATADGLDDGRVSGGIALALGADISPGTPRYGYSRCDVVREAEDVLAEVYGGSSREGEVHVQVTSSACDRVVPLLRRLWPDHRVSRADSALDFLAEFDAMDAIALQFARDRGLKFRLVTDSERGATRYLGSPSSEVMVRLYRKSEQLRKKYPERAHEVPDGVVRAEVQVRPSKREVKDAAGRLHPDDFWGFGEWSRDFAQAVLALDPVRTSTHFRRPTEWSRSVHYLGQQYGPGARRRAEEIGRDAALAEIAAALGLA